MAQTRGSTTRRSTKRTGSSARSSGSRSSSRSRGSARSSSSKSRQPRSLARLDKSINASQDALKELRKELGRGGRDVLKDIEKTLKDSRKNLTSLTRTVGRDLGKVQRAAT